MKRGFVYLVGAGPGDPGLITRRGAALVEVADVIVYDGLVNAALLDLAIDADLIYAGKKHLGPGKAALTQDEINALLVDRAQKGQMVVRLKGGDPFVFGRGAEECRALDEAGVAYEVVPGVTAATAVAAYAGIPLTARGVSSTVAMATGHEAAGKPSSDVDWQGLAREGTVVLFMARKTARDCCRRLVEAGRDASTPAAAIYWGTTAAQRTVVSTLDGLADAVDAAGLKPPVLLVIGDVVSQRPEQGSWYERRPMFGKRVVITRDLERSAELSRLLAEHGAEPIAMPVTQIDGPAEDQAKQAVSYVERVGDYDWVIFSSANAVDQLFAVLTGFLRRDARAFVNAKVACVGGVTADALRAHGIEPDLVPHKRDASGLASELLARDDAPSRALVVRAVAGRNEAIDMLRDGGTSVDVALMYETVPTPADAPTIAYGLQALRARTVDVVCFYAPSQVRAVFDVLGDDAGELVSACQVVAAIGNTTRAALEKRGVAVHVVPENPASVVFANAIVRALSKET